MNNADIQNETQNPQCQISKTKCQMNVEFQIPKFGIGYLIFEIRCNDF